MSTAVGIKSFISIDDKIKPQAIPAGYGSPVFVIFTSMSRTLKAMEKACELAHPLQAGIEVIAVETVPFTLPLDRPPVPFEFIVRHLEEMANHFREPTMISAYLCRDDWEALKRALNPNCPVVIGVRKMWWLTHDGRIVRKLRHAGYKVICVEME